MHECVNKFTVVLFTELNNTPFYDEILHSIINTCAQAYTVPSSKSISVFISRMFYTLGEKRESI